MTGAEERKAPARRANKGLDREVVVQAALRRIDAGGLRSLTMRELGQDLRVEAMSLYRYVSGREDLLEAVVALLLDNFYNDLDDTITGSWQCYLQALAHGIRQIAVDHPAAFPLVATRHPAASWLRPPLRSVALVEQFLSSLLAYGFNDGQVVDTYRAFSGFLLGQLLLDSAARGAEMASVKEPLDGRSALVLDTDAPFDTSIAPTVVRLRTLLSEDRSTKEFEGNLKSLIDRLELSLTQ